MTDLQKLIRATAEHTGGITMNKHSKRSRALVFAAAAVAVLVGVGIINAETIKKLHPAPQLIINSLLMNNTTETDSTVVDLSGGDLDKFSFMVHVTSATNAKALTLDIALSADGGTTWVTDLVNRKTITGNSLTPLTSSYVNIGVAPATKLKLIPTLASDTTFYTFKVWAMPSVD
jgi:hypothetical protein